MHLFNIFNGLFHKKMKGLKMIRATNQFQTIIDRYEKSRKKKKKLDSLNTLFIKDLKQIKSHNNFSDEEYMINEIKNINKKKNERISKIYKINSNEDMMTNEKISKDIFFYYRNKLNKNVNNNVEKQRNNGNLNYRYNSAINRIDSGKRSIESSYTRQSHRRKSNISLILPIINHKNYNFNKNNLSNNRSFISDEDTTNIINFLQSDKNIQNEPTEEIEKEEIKTNNNKKDKKLFYKYSELDNNKKNKNKMHINNFNDILKNLRMKKCEKELICKLNLPLIKNDIFNKINNVTRKSQNIYKSINYLSTEGNIAYENELNRIKFLNEIIN